MGVSCNPFVQRSTRGNLTTVDLKTIEKKQIRYELTGRSTVKQSLVDIAKNNIEVHDVDIPSYK